MGVVMTLLRLMVRDLMKLNASSFATVREAAKADHVCASLPMLSHVIP